MSVEGERWRVRECNSYQFLQGAGAKVEECNVEPDQRQVLLGQVPERGVKEYDRQLANIAIFGSGCRNFLIPALNTNRQKCNPELRF